ncbi:hypothetical protein PoB_004685100 [Plakobranchus ocellatus]|uniref:Uncharacterized protein n=1 Tax=Plakobranchus ocellatus TaxID=259542 RepID=A0AAV4BIT4_9GAST|nr:hypothetical protein PoB_004685100 [Plakobranchus ocellatus]
MLLAIRNQQLTPERISCDMLSYWNTKARRERNISSKDFDVSPSKRESARKKREREHQLKREGREIELQLKREEREFHLTREEMERAEREAERQKELEFAEIAEGNKLLMLESLQI